MSIYRRYRYHHHHHHRLLRHWQHTIKYTQYIYKYIIIEIKSISVTVSYRHVRYWFFRYIDIVSLISEISVICQYFVILFRHFNVKDNYMSKNQYRICQCDQLTSLHVPCYMSASLKWKLKVYSNELFFISTNERLM